MARPLRPAEELIAPCVAGMLAAYDPPPADAPLAALARTLAATIDAMPPGVRQAMLPQHTGPLLKVLTELDMRARRREGGREPGRKPNQLEQLRAAHARATRGRVV